jgi:hypothetical protein
MIDIGSTEFYIKTASLPPADFEVYSSRIFDDWERRISQELNLEDYALLLEIEEGSVKGRGRIRTGLKAVFYTICGYGSLTQGLQYIRDHVSLAGDYLTTVAHTSLGPDNPAPEVRKKSGTIGQLQRLFVRVQRREMSVDDAISDAEKLIGEDASESPEFMARLNDSLKSTQLKPEQISLPLDGLEEALPIEEQEKTRKPKVPKPSATIPPSNQLRVEIWKESKRGKKIIRVTNLV